MENRMVIYHGSIDVVDAPSMDKCLPSRDYGKGFYCTADVGLAREWACMKDVDGFVNEYNLDMSGLSVLDLSSEKYHVLNWIAILLENREFQLDTPLAVEVREYILENFLPKYKDYDVVIGYRADDSYFTFAKDFIRNNISIRQLDRAMKLGKLGLQVFLQSLKAFEQLSFVGANQAEKEIYYLKYKLRDDDARNEYMNAMRVEKASEGLYALDIIRGGIKNEDKRLR